MKKKFALLLSFILVLSTLAACGGGGTSALTSSGTTATSQTTSEDATVNMDSYPIVDEPITFSMMGMKHPIQGDWENLLFFKEMEELTNISFTYDTPTLEVFEEKKNLALNTGSYPDVFFGALLSQQQQVKYGEQGIIIPLEEYLDEYCPNVVAMLDEYPEIRQSITAPDGHIYALPQYNAAPIAMVNAGWININALNDIGMTEADLPRTTGEFKEMLEKMKDAGYAAPLSLASDDQTKKGNTIYNIMMPMFGIPYGGTMFYVDDNGKVQHSLFHENIPAFLEYANELWNEKLLDNDSFVQGTADMAAKGASGQIGVGYHAIPQIIYGNMENEVAATYPAMWALSSPVSSEPYYTQEMSGIQHGTFAITDKCTNVPAMLRWIDYLYSEEGSLLIHYGPEGVFYDVEDNGLMYHLPNKEGDNRSQEEVRGGDITPDCGTPMPKFVRPETEGAWDDPMQQTRIKQVDEKIAPYMALAMPDMYLNSEEQAIADTLSTDISKYFQENTAALVTGEKGLDELDSVKEGMGKLGLQDLIDVYQSAYDRWKASN